MLVKDVIDELKSAQRKIRESSCELKKRQESCKRDVLKKQYSEANDVLMSSFASIEHVLLILGEI